MSFKKRTPMQQRRAVYKLLKLNKTVHQIHRITGIGKYRIRNIIRSTKI